MIIAVMNRREIKIYVNNKLQLNEINLNETIIKKINLFCNYFFWNIGYVDCKKSKRTNSSFIRKNKKIIQ